MDGWTIFSSFTAQVDAPLKAAVGSVVGQLFPSALQAFQGGLMIWIALLGYRLVWGRGAAPLQDMTMGIVTAAAVSSAMSLAVYNQYVTTLFLTDIPSAVSSLAGGAFSVASFDALWGRAYAAGLRTWQAAGWSISVIPIGFMIVVFWFVSLACIGLGYVVWLAAHVILYLAVAIGPLFFVAYLFPPVRGFFERWVGVLVSATVVQILVAVLLSVILAAETQLMGGISAGGDPLAAMQMLLVAAILFVFCALLLKEVPGIGTALAGGVHFQAGRFTQAVVGLGGRAVGRLGSAGGGITTRAVGNVRASSGVSGRALSGMPGQSLSAGGAGA